MYSEVRLTQQLPLDVPCSGEEVVLQCTLQEVTVVWTFPGGDVTLIPGSSEQVSGNFRAQPVGVVNGNFTSNLTFPAENGVITCFNGQDRSMSDTLTVTVQGMYFGSRTNMIWPNTVRKKRSYIQIIGTYLSEAHTSKSNCGFFKCYLS